MVAKIALEHNVHLQQVKGTGLKRRITKKDVLAYIESNRETPMPDTKTTDTLIPHTTIRRRIAEHMVLSKHTSPHVTTVFEADMSKIVAHRNRR